MSADFVFRADASLVIGSGHVMRCLTLADALKAHGYRCHFICREFPANLFELIEERGHGLTALPTGSHPESENTTVHGHWLRADWREDAEQTVKELQRLAPQWLIVDHYALDAQWEAVVQQKGLKLGVIDDLADRPHCCNWLLDQNLGRRERDYSGKVPHGCVCLIGPEYALLRPEFAEWRPYSLSRRTRRPVLNRLLVSLGGVDNDNVTGRVLSALENTELLKNAVVTVVLGQDSPWISQTRGQAEKLDLHVDVKVGVGNMAELLSESDLCIGAAGGSVWERCCLGVPSWLVVLAENQKQGAKALESAGAARIVFQKSPLQSGVDNLSFDQGLRNWSVWSAETSRLVALLVDGMGVSRVVKSLVEWESKGGIEFSH